MSYIENPKTKGSGIICAIPQKGRCPNECPDCFYNSGRSYLEPLGENTPNMPLYEDTIGRIVHVNDGNDSGNRRRAVMDAVGGYGNKFYNTCIPEGIEGFHAPVVLTVNPGELTDANAYFLGDIPENLMFVRVRVNTWNLPVVDLVVGHYTARDVPVVLTFMAYFKTPVPESHKEDYVWRKRTLNPYWCIKRDARRKICDRYKNNIWVDECGRAGVDVHCRHCGTCLREWYAAMERMTSGV